VAAALPLYRRALAIREAALGPQHPYVAISLNSLAEVLHVQGDAAAALLLYRRALAIREANLGPQQPDLASSLVNLGQALIKQGDVLSSGGAALAPARSGDS
jgi:hypothetical protein